MGLSSYSKKRGILSAAMLVIMLVVFFAVPQHAQALDIGEGLKKIAAPLLKALATVLLQLSSYILGLAGIILNNTLDFTVVNMRDTIDQIAGIDIAWTVIRDLINISFIFIILYAAISTILDLGGNWKKTVKNVVIAAILINFSLFFTKVIIDASNILALALHSSMVPSVCRGSFACGLSDSFMQVLGVSGFYGVQGLPDDPTAVAVIGVMGSIFMLIAAFIFLVVSVLFLVRFVALIFVLIFSPVGMFGSFLPGIGGSAKKWWDTLIGQAVFAPLYMLLTWVVLTIAGGLQNALVLGRGNIATALNGGLGAGATATPEPGAISIILNYIILIAFLIMSIVISRSYAQQGFSNYAQKLVGGVLGGSVGVAAWTGRKTLGRAGQMALQSDTLKEKAASGSMAARMALRAGNTAANSSFDVRATRILSKGESAAKTLGMGGLADVGLDMKAGGKGGYSKAYDDRQKELIKKYEDRGKLLEPKTEAEKELLKKKRQAEFESLKAHLDAQAPDRYEESLARADFEKQRVAVEAELKAANEAPALFDATGKAIDKTEKIKDLEARKKEVENKIAKLNADKKKRVDEERAADRARFESLGGLNNETLEKLKDDPKALKKYKEEQEQKKKDAESGKDRVIRYAEGLKASNAMGNMPIIGIGSDRKEARAKYLSKLKKGDKKGVDKSLKDILKESGVEIAEEGAPKKEEGAEKPTTPEVKDGK